jgi:hypothetical protein
MLERDGTEFVCRDCGANVYITPPLDPTPEICTPCWHRSQHVRDPMERERLRQLMRETAE